MSVVDPVPPRRKLSVPQSRYQSRSPDHLRPPVPPTHAVPRPPPLGPAKDGEARPRRHSRSKSPDSPRSVASPGTAILNHSAILKEFQEEIGDVAVNPEGHFNKFFKVRFQIKAALRVGDKIHDIIGVVRYMLGFLAKNAGLRYRQRLRRTVMCFHKLGTWVRHHTNRRRAAVNAMVEYWVQEEEGMRRSISQKALQGSDSAKHWQTLRRNSRLYSTSLVPDSIKTKLAGQLYFERSMEFRRALNRHTTQKLEHEKEIAELKNTIEQRKKAGWPPSATPHAVALRGLATAKFNLQCLKVNRPVFKFEAGPAVHKELLNRSKELGIVQSLALSQAGAFERGESLRTIPSLLRKPVAPPSPRTSPRKAIMPGSPEGTPQGHGDATASEFPFPMENSMSISNGVLLDQKSDDPSPTRFLQRHVLEDPYVRCGLTPPSDPFREGFAPSYDRFSSFSKEKAIIDEMVPRMDHVPFDVSLPLIPEDDFPSVFHPRVQLSATEPPAAMSPPASPPGGGGRRGTLPVPTLPKCGSPAVHSPAEPGHVPHAPRLPTVKTRRSASLPATHEVRRPSLVGRRPSISKSLEHSPSTGKAP